MYKCNTRNTDTKKKSILNKNIYKYIKCPD